MKRLLLAGVFLVVVAGCQLWDKPGYYGSDGTFVPPSQGVFTMLSEGSAAAEGAGVPFAGAVGGLLGIVGGIGAYLTDKRRKKDLQSVVRLFDKLKPKLAEIANEKQLETFILEHAPEDSAFGRVLKRAWVSLKKI